MEKYILSHLFKIEFNSSSIITIIGQHKTFRISSTHSSDLLITFLNSFQKSIDKDFLTQNYTGNDLYTISKFWSFLERNSIIITESENRNLTNHHLHIGMFPFQQITTFPQKSSIYNIGIIYDHPSSYIISKFNFSHNHYIIDKLCITPHQAINIEDNALNDFFNKHYDILLLFIDYEDIEFLSQINEKAFEFRQQWIPFYSRNTHYILGPIINPPTTPCWLCSNHSFETVSQHRLDNICSVQYYPSEWINIICSVVSQELFLLQTTGTSNLLGRIFEYNFISYTSQYTKVLFNPNCPICNEIF